MTKKSLRKKNTSSLLSSKLFFVVAVVVVFFIGTAVAKSFSQRYAVNSEIEDLKSEIQQLEREQQDLSNLLQYLESEEFIKQEGKVKFGLREEGEKLVVVDDGKTTQPPKLQVTSDTEMKLSNPQKWWRIFFN